MRLILVRHGETAWNEERLVQGGDVDVELNDTGLAQAARVADFLSTEAVNLVLSSPLLRARATAEAIAYHHGLPVQTDTRLTELRLGALDGMSISSLNTTFSQFLSGWWQEKGPTMSPDGETFVQLQDRTWPVVQDLLMQLNVPALVIIGQKDAQVDWEVDGGLLQAATADLAHIDYEFPENADHVLKYQPKPREEVTPADAREYNAAGRVLDAETVEAIVNWLMQQTQAD